MEFATAVEKYELIYKTISNDKNVLNISWLCEAAGVSRSGYYAWISRMDNISDSEIRDRADFNLILEAYKHRGYDKGSRGIEMRLRHAGNIMNRKKVQPLMRKFNLRCKIRQPNPYRRYGKGIKNKFSSAKHC